MSYRYLSHGQRRDTGLWIAGVARLEGKRAYILGMRSIKGGASQDREAMWDTTWTEVAPATVAQCTALSAAHSYRGAGTLDMLVYEKDLVSCAAGIMEIGWNDEKACFEAYRNGNHRDVYHMRAVRRGRIIGKIHDEEASIWKP